MTTTTVLDADDVLRRTDIAGFYASRLPGFKVNGSMNVKTMCPFCRRKAAFSVNVETGAWHCFGADCQKAGTLYQFVEQADGVDFVTALKTVDEWNGNGATKPVVKTRRRFQTIPERVNGAVKVAEYQFTLDNCTGSAVKARYQYENGDKTFRWYEVDGETYRDGLGGRQADLYKLAEVRAGIERGATILLNEGEKAVDAFSAYDGDDTRDIVATCGPHGAGSFSKENGERLALQLAGAPAVLTVVDRDDDGARCAEDARRHLESRVGRLRFVQSAVTTAKADLYDHLEAGHGIGALVPYASEPIVEVTLNNNTGMATSNPAGIDAVVETFRRHCYLPDPRGLYAVLGAYAANQHREAEPVWMLVVGASGSGKTETVETIKGMDGVFSVSTLTEAALLSGTSKKDQAKGAKGGLLREIGEHGIFLVKDFTSILSMHRDARAGVLAALREIYDGSYVRRLGTDGGKSYAWNGRVGLIGCVTPVIDSHHAVIASMGERFLFYRMPDVDRGQLTRSALRHSRTGGAMRREIAEAVASLLATLDFGTEAPIMSDARTDQLVALADYVALARSAVERDGRTREIELVVGAEAPTRLVICLSRLLDGMRAIGVDDTAAWNTLVKVALDCIPSLRRRVLDVLADGGIWTLARIAGAVAHPKTTTTRALEELEAYGLADREIGGKDGAWSLSVRAGELRQAVPEMSEVTQSGASI